MIRLIANPDSVKSASNSAAVRSLAPPNIAIICMSIRYPMTSPFAGSGSRICSPTSSTAWGSIAARHDRRIRTQSASGQSCSTRMSRYTSPPLGTASKKLPAGRRDSPVRQRVRRDCSDDVVSIEEQPTRSREATEDLAQRLTVPAPDIDDQRGRGEVVRSCERGKAIVREARHHLVEHACFIGMVTQILESALLPCNLVRHLSGQRRIQHSPCAP